MIVNSINNNEEFILLNNDIAEKIKNFKTKISSNDNLTNFIKEKLVNSKNRQGISCRKLSAMYFEETGKYACKTKNNNIIKSKLGYHFLKTSKKSNFLLTDLGRILCLTFIKTLIKCLMTGFDLLFIDESSIQLNNSNYRCWRKYEEQIYFGDNNAGKLNLLLCISKNEILYYELNKENTNSQIFLNFMFNVNKIIKQKLNSKFCIIMDNFACHKTEELFKF